MTQLNLLCVTMAAQGSRRGSPRRVRFQDSYWGVGNTEAVMAVDAYHADPESCPAIALEFFVAVRPISVCLLDDACQARKFNPT